MLDRNIKCLLKYISILNEQSTLINNLNWRMIQDNIDEWSASVSYSCHKNKQIISQPDIVLWCQDSGFFP